MYDHSTVWLYYAQPPKETCSPLPNILYGIALTPAILNEMNLTLLAGSVNPFIKFAKIWEFGLFLCGNPTLIRLGNVIYTYYSCSQKYHNYTVVVFLFKALKRVVCHFCTSNSS